MKRRHRRHILSKLPLLVALGGSLTAPGAQAMHSYAGPMTFGAINEGRIFGAGSSALKTFGIESPRACGGLMAQLAPGVQRATPFKTDVTHALCCYVFGWEGSWWEVCVEC